MASPVEQSDSQRGKDFVTSPPAISPPSTKKDSVKFQTQVNVESQSDSDEFEEDDASLIMKALRAILGWMTPYEQMTFLRRKRDLKRWELFRDALMRRWSNLNVICGLIMGAVSTIVFADFPLSRASFTLGIISLLSSLIAIGFGVGLIYVLGDVRGSSIVMVDDRYPRLHLLALSIPEVWAFVSFGTFFADMSVIVWEADDKGWVVKAGVSLAAAAFIGHLVAFGFLFREQDTTAFLIPDEPVFPSNEQKSEIRESQSPSPSHSQRQTTNSTVVPEEFEMKGKATSLNSLPSSYSKAGRKGSERPEMPSRTFMSSQTLVESPSASQMSFRSPPIRASTAPVASAAHLSSADGHRSIDGFVAKPAGEIVPAGTGDEVRKD